MIICAIETSCDETSVAIAKSSNINSDLEVLSNTVSSQIKIHSRWGGVVPNLAAREHLKNIIPVLDKSLHDAKIKLSQIDLFAVTQGPGLIPALLIGTNTAKALAYTQNKPLLGIHHIEGHIYATLLEHQDKSSDFFPILSLVVSGGHTQLILMKKHFQYKVVGETQDDAVGEAFDKVAKMLGLGYPGGPVVSSRAQQFEKYIYKMEDNKFKQELQSISFPRPMLNRPNLDFSFSGLKTSVLYFIKEIEKNNITKKQLGLYKNAICHAFQKAAVDVLVAKTFKAVKKYSPSTLLVAGGVAANKKLVEELKKRAAIHNDIQFIHPKLEYCGDNAAMIAVAAYHRYDFLKQKSRLSELDQNWSILEASANFKLQNIK